MKIAVIAWLLVVVMQARPMHPAAAASKNDMAPSGIVIDVSNCTRGLEIEGQVFTRGSRFIVETVAQSIHYGSDTKATLVTIGPQAEYYPAASMVVLFVRSGKDFGENVVTQSIGGLSVNAGVRISEAELVKAIEKFHKLFH